MKPTLELSHQGIGKLVPLAEDGVDSAFVIPVVVRAVVGPEKGFL